MMSASIVTLPLLVVIWLTAIFVLHEGVGKDLFVVGGSLVVGVIGYVIARRQSRGT